MSSNHAESAVKTMVGEASSLLEANDVPRSACAAGHSS